MRKISHIQDLLNLIYPFSFCLHKSKMVRKKQSMANRTNQQQEEELDKIVREKWTNHFRKSYVTVKGCMLPENYLKIQKSIDDFIVFDSDIWICSFPRTGTTWMSEMVWLITNDCNFERAKISMFDRIRFLDLSFLAPIDENSHPSMSDSVGYAKNQPHPRFIKSHLPFPLLPTQIQNGQRKPKVIYICRNPLDACISYYYHAASMIFSGSIEEFCKLYLSGKMVYGAYWNHVLPFWRLKEQSNILFLKYEDMKYNFRDTILQTANFLGKALTPEQINALEEHLSFEAMKKNPSITGAKELDVVKEFGPIKSPFVRAGIVGGYKREMPEQFIDIFQNWMKTNLEGTGLNFRT